MKISLRILFVVLLFLSNLSLYSQDQLGFYGSLSHGKLVEESKVDFFDTNCALSFGFLYSMKLNDRFHLITQVGYEDLGWIAKEYDGFSLDEDLFFKGKSITLFLGSKYDFISTAPYRLGILILPKIGYQFKQEYIAVKGDTEIISLFTASRDFIYGLESKIDLQISLSESIHLGIRPGFNWFTYFDSNTYIRRNLSVDFTLSKRIVFENY